MTKWNFKKISYVVIVITLPKNVTKLSLEGISTLGLPSPHSQVSTTLFLT